MERRVTSDFGSTQYLVDLTGHFGMHRYDQAVERIKARNNVKEARAWLKAAEEDHGVIHELSRKESIDVVEKAYELGAVLVEAIGQFADDAIDSSTDMLLITLPEDKSQRMALFALEETVANMSGCQLSVDEGQKYVLLLWT